MKTYRLLSAFLIITSSILVPILIPTATAETLAEQLTKLLGEGNFLYTQNKYNQALETFENVLALDSNNTFAMDRIGTILYNVGKVNDSMTYFDKSLVADPNNTGTLNKKGLVLVTLGNHTASVRFV